MSTCRWTASHQPRMLNDRHEDGCESETCRGCLPCPAPHCVVCYVAHHEGVCPECMAETRESLHEIGRMCGSLPAEVEHRGVEGEAFTLLGPAADPEARGHLEASVAVGRVPAHYLDDAGDERHPSFVLGGWLMVWADALDHDTEATELPDVIDYLDRQMTYMSTWPHTPFEDFARDVRRCRVHLESVLHDGEQVERGARCPECKAAGRTPRSLHRTYGPRPDGGQDAWRCPHRDCQHVMTLSDHVHHVYREYLDKSPHLTAKQMRVQYGVPEGTLRRWANETREDGTPLVRKRGYDADNRQLYDVDDALAMRDQNAAGRVA